MHTYFGLLDDFAERHRDAAITSLGALNNHLLTAALFEGPLLINDGYLLNHPVLQAAVVDADSSPLRALVEAGFVKILTRNDRSLGTLAEDMADAGIESAKRLLGQDTYGRQLQPALNQWAERLEVAEPESAFRDWPRAHVSQLFARLAATALDRAIDGTAAGSSRENLMSFQKLFGIGGPSANRTNWEEAADSMREQGKISHEVHNALMLMGNEAYQHAWGCALAEGGKDVAVLTRAPLYLDLDRPVGRLDPENPPQGVTVLGPDIAVAGKRVGRKWVLLAEIVRSGHPMTYLKAEFLDALKRHYANPGIGDDGVKRAARRYSNALAEHFGSRRRGFVFDIGSTITTTAVGTAVAGPVGAGIGLGFGLFTNVANYTFGPKLLARLSTQFGKPWITTRRTRMSPVTSSFQLDPQEAARYLAAVDDFPG